MEWCGVCIYPTNICACNNKIINDWLVSVVCFKSGWWWWSAEGKVVVVVSCVKWGEARGMQVDETKSCQGNPSLVAGSVKSKWKEKRKKVLLVLSLLSFPRSIQLVVTHQLVLPHVIPGGTSDYVSQYFLYYFVQFGQGKRFLRHSSSSMKLCYFFALFDHKMKDMLPFYSEKTSEPSCCWFFFPCNYLSSEMRVGNWNIWYHSSVFLLMFLSFLLPVFFVDPHFPLFLYVSSWLIPTYVHMLGQKKKIKCSGCVILAFLKDYWKKVLTPIIIFLLRPWCFPYRIIDVRGCV